MILSVDLVQIFFKGVKTVLIRNIIGMQKIYGSILHLSKISFYFENQDLARVRLVRLVIN